MALQDLDRLPNINDFRDEASAILDVQCPGTSGLDRESRIRVIAECLRVINEANNVFIMVAAESPAQFIEGDLGDVV